MSLSGKVAIVTGAGSGIGAATAALFANEGARVTLVDLSETKLKNVAQQFSAHNTTPLIIQADVTNEMEAKTIIDKTVAHFGQLDVLVNNAGIYKEALITDPNILQNFDSIMNTNLRSIVHLTSISVPHLVATKGTIINVSSVASRSFGVARSSYSVSKAGLEHFTRCAALELSVSGIRVNSVHPGPVRTSICANNNGLVAAPDDPRWDKIKNTTALGRVCEPAEIADLIAFLASDKARSVTGSAYFCDNGFLLKGF